MRANDVGYSVRAREVETAFEIRVSKRIDGIRRLWMWHTDNPSFRIEAGRRASLPRTLFPGETVTVTFDYEFPEPDMIVWEFELESEQAR